MNICKMKRSTQIAIMANAGSTTIEKTVSGTSPLTLSDSVAGNIHSITVKGHSEVVDGAIKSIGDATGATPTLGITSKNGEGQGTAATITTGLPLRSVSESIYDTLDNDKVVKKCAEVDLGTLTYEYDSRYNIFAASLLTAPLVSGRTGVPALCPNYDSAYDKTIDQWINFPNLTISVGCSWSSQEYKNVVIKNTAYTDATTFKAAMSGVKLVYELTTPTETPLTSAEIVALAALKTYDPTTVISVTDNPSITVKYMGKNITRTAPKKRTSRKKKA